jgi:hypothetical protein
MDLSNYVPCNSRKLTGPALNWAVARSLNMAVSVLPPNYGSTHRVFVSVGADLARVVPFRPTSNWDDCGQLISRFNMSFIAMSDGVEAMAERMHGIGSDHKEAACRAVVSALMGETILVPEDLCGFEQGWVSTAQAS